MYMTNFTPKRLAALASPKRLAGLIALACAAALAPAAALAVTAAPAAPAATAAARAPRCATSGLVIWLTRDGVAAGSVFYTLNFTNLSGHACRLDGHPGVSAVTLGGRQVGSPAGWAPPAPHSVRLARGATAYALVQYSDVIVSGSGPEPCHAVTAAGLRVYPPDQTRSRIVPFPLRACARRGLVYMTVRPVQKTQP
jgi:hypothetical protein